MARLDGNPTLLNALHNNTPFVYAHLVKFERPGLTSVPGSASTFSLNDAKNFAYFSDGAFDIVFDDGTKNSIGLSNGAQTYVANKLISIGSISDSSDVKTTSTNLVLDATPIGASFTGSLDVTATQIIAGISEPIGTFEELGFRVDDKIVISGYSGSELRITGFTSNGSASAMTYVNVGTTTQPTFSGQVKTITLKSEEITGLIHSSAIDKVSFMHRRVTIYKAFFYAESPHLFIGSPLELFNGTITNATFEEDPEKGTKVTWNLSNFLGDFRRVKGRLTSHEAQQAFGSSARGDSRSSYVPAASEDRGFEHAEKSVSFLAPYTDFEKETKYKKKKILFGLLGSYKEPNGYNLIPVTREVDIRFDLQAKYLPVVYGVQRVKGIPVFADLDRDLTSTGSSSVYTANAICEGPIQSVMNVYIDDKALNCMSADDAITRNPFNSGSTDDQKAEAKKQDVFCVGTATQGLVLIGNLPHSSFFQKQNNTHSQQTDANGDPANPDNANAATSDGLTEQMMNSAPAKTDVGVYDNSGLGLATGESGITHRKAIKTPTDMMEMVMEFYMGLNDQPASTILASQAEPTGNGGGGGFLLQEQLGLLNSPDGYWGQNHRLLDTAYAVNNFIVTAEESTIPSLDYVVNGKLLDCFNYDGSFMHSNLSAYSSENHENFKEGDSVKLDSTRAFTSTLVKLNSSGTIVLMGDGVGSGESQFIRTAGQEMLTTTIIDKFFYRDHEGTQHYRFRWDITAAEETLLREIGYFYMENGSNQWHMVTYDAQDIDTSSTITVAEIFEAEVSQTSTGAAAFAGTLSNITAASSTISDYDLTNVDALFFQANPDGVGADSYFSTSSPTIVNISGTTITAPNTQSTRPLPSDAKVVLNQIRLSTSASNTDDIYNGKFIYFRRTTGDIGIVLHRKVIDYDGTTKIATLDNTFLEGRILPNDIITFSERQSEIPHNLSPLEGSFAGDLRPSTNFAMIALDYIKSNRYGLDIPLDKINITDFLLAATECDSQSDVTIRFNSAVTLVPGEVYRYISNGHEKWRGTVVHNYNAETGVYGGTGIEDNWLFTNVTGKLTNKYNDWYSRKVGDLIYQEGNESVYIKEGSEGVQTAITDGASIATTVTLTKVSSGSGPASARIKTTGWTNTTAKPVTYSLYDSDDLPYWKYLGWPELRQRYATRHQGNLTIDTAAPALDNLKGILQHFNGLLYHSNGKLRIKIGAGRAADGPESDANFNDSNIDVDVKVRYITDEDIIGKISIKDEGLNKAQNTVSASVSDPALDFNDRSITFVNPEFKKEDRGLEKSANFAVPGITNYYNARLAAEQSLKFSRFSRYISFVMRPAGIAILPGELIRIKYPRFGWDVGSEVLFRVKTVSIAKDCLVSITAEEHDDSIYFISRNIRSPFFIDEIVRQKARIPGKPTMRTPQSASTPSPNIIRWNAATGVAERGGGYEVWRAENFSGDASIAVTAIPTAELVATVGANQLELADLKTESPTSKSFIYWVRAFNDSVPQTSSGVRKAERRYYGDFNDDSDYGGVGQANAARLALKALEESITISFSTFGLTIPADEDGNNPDFSNINGQITVEIANTDITSQCTFSLANPVGFNQSATPPNFVVNAGGAYTITGITASTASIDVTAAIPANAVTGLSVSTSVTKKFITTLSPKIKPRSIALGIPTSEYNENNTNPNPSSVTVTATAGGTVGTPFYEFRVNTGSGFSTVQNGTGNTISYSYPTNFSDVKNQQIHVKLREGSNSGDVLAQAFANPSATSKGNPGVPGNPGADAYTVRGSNENHTFVADTTGAVSMTGFSCDFTVRKGSTLYTYVASGNTAGTFKYGTITATNVIQVVNSSSGQITLAGGSAIASGLTVITGSLQVPIIDNENSVVITTVVITFSKSIKASRDGGIFTFEESTNSNITSTVAAAFAENTGQASTSFTNSAAQAAATAVIAASIDGFLRPNDRVTITDNSQNVAGTRIYTGTGTTSGGSVSTSDFSSLVVETFNGSVIVDGTLSADKLTANTTTTNTLNIGSNLVLANAGKFYTTNKTAYTDTDAGFFLGWDGSTHQLNLGNNTDYIKWDGTNLQVAGSIFFDNASSIGLESFNNDNTGFTNDDTANSKAAVFRQNNVPTSGVKAGDIWIDTNDNNKLYVAAADGSDQVAAGEWVLAQDSTSAADAASSAANAASTADGKADDAQNTADSKIRVFRQSTIPTAVSVGDIWVNTTNGANAVYVAASVGANQITSGEWIESRDGRTQHFDDNGDVSLGINIGPQGHIRGGINAANNSGTGVFLGFKTGNTSTPFFSVGNPFVTNGKGITWDGTNLNVRGNIFFNNANTIGISSFNNDEGFTDDTQADAATLAASNAASDASAAQGDATSALNKSQHFDANGDISLGINIGTAGHIRGGQTGFNSGSSGFFLGYSSGYKFSIGNPSGNRLTWNGSTLFITGSIRIGGSSTTLTELNTLNTNTTKNDVDLGNLNNNNYNSSGDMDDGKVGGWDIDNEAIFSGTKDTEGYAAAGGITLNSAGSIHAKEFYIDTSGNAFFKGNIDSGGTVSAQALDLDGTTLTGGAGGLKISTSGVDTLQVAGNAITEHTMDHFNDKEVSRFITSYQTLGTSQSVSGHAATMITKATVSVIALDNNTYGTGDGINFDVKVEELRNGSVINNTTYTNFAVRDANVSTVVLPLITTISSGFTYTYRISGKINSHYGSAEEVKWLRPTVETTMLKR